MKQKKLIQNLSEIPTEDLGRLIGTSNAERIEAASTKEWLEASITTLSLQIESAWRSRNSTLIKEWEAQLAVLRDLHQILPAFEKEES